MTTQIEVILVVISVEPDAGLVNYLAKNVGHDQYELPRKPLEDKSSLNVVRDILFEETGLEARIGFAGWVELKQIPVVDNVDRISEGTRLIGIPFACLIPGKMVEISKDSTWIQGKMLSQTKMVMDHLEIMQAANQIMS
jgi:hypothetical protein